MAEEINAEVVEDVQEDALLEDTEVVEETAEDSKEDKSLDEAVLSVLIGESTEEDEEVIAEDAEEETEEEDIVEEVEETEESEEESLEEAKHSKKMKKEMDHSKKKKNEEEDEEDEDEEDEEEEKEEQAPKTKAESLNRLYKEMKGMKKSQLEATLDSITELITATYENVEDDGNDAVKATVAAIAKSANDAKGKTKGDMLSAAYGMMKNMKKHNLQANYGKMMNAMKHIKHGKMDESFDLESEIDLLTQADSNLTEDFKGKAKVIFEAAINNKVADIKESLEAQYEADLQEELGHVRETLVEKIDDYLTYVVEDWVEANAETVDAELRSEITEDFMKGLHSLFVESYIDVPESKRDLVADLSEENVLVKESLDQAESDKEDLQEKLEELLREKIIRENSSDMTSTQVEKLVNMLEGAEFVSEEDFTEKVKTLKATFFGETEEVNESASTSGDVEVIVEGQPDVDKTIPSGMAHYVNALSRMEKNSSIIS
jgi:hypothetical protein